MLCLGIKLMLLLIQFGIKNFNKAISNSKERIAHNEQFKLIEDNAKWIDSRSEESIV
jgi:hypothetical protein